jgi:Polyketide cyclase / dehydrase and lipid transport
MNNVDVQCVRVNAHPAGVFELMADPANLPRWAVGFAKSVESAEDGVVVVTGNGDRIPVQVRSDARSGVVDFVMNSATDGSATAWVRVVPAGDAAIVSFAQAQPDEMPDEMFAAQVAAVTHELAALKALAEVSCPR